MGLSLPPALLLSFGRIRMQALPLQITWPRRLKFACGKHSGKCLRKLRNGWPFSNLKAALACVQILLRLPDMQLSFRSERVMTVIAHPDDAELLCAGTLARAKLDGAAVAICVLCQGDKGLPGGSAKNAVSTRRNEMLASAKLLGAELFTAHSPDGSLADDFVTRRLLMENLRQFKP